MNKKLLAGVVILIIALGAWVAAERGYFTRAGKNIEIMNNGKTTAIVTEAQFDGRNATFKINGITITLVNGISEIEAASGSASKIVTRYFGNEAYGDLTGDGKADVAFLVTQETGGSGLFYYAVVAIRTADGYATTNGFFIGDRIAPQSTYIPINSLELDVNYAERKPGEPMTAQPSVGAVKLIKVTSEGVLEGLMK